MLQRRRLILSLIAALACSLSWPTSAPAQAPFPNTLVRFYAHFVRSVNPHLAQTQCRMYAQAILTNARRLHLDPALLAAVVTVESHWNPSARSPHGAQGLGQLMPATARELGVNPYSGPENLRGTSIYLHRLLTQFRAMREPLRYAVAGYNAGPAAVKRCGGIPPTHETQRYVVKVMYVLNTVHARSRSAGVVAWL